MHVVVAHTAPPPTGYAAKCTRSVATAAAPEPACSCIQTLPCKGQQEHYQRHPAAPVRWGSWCRTTYLESLGPCHLPVVHTPEVLQQLVGKELSRVPAL